MCVRCGVYVWMCVIQVSCADCWREEAAPDPSGPGLDWPEVSQPSVAQLHPRAAAAASGSLLEDGWELTAVMKCLQHFAEDALVRLSIGMRDEHVHVAARGLPSAVGAASHGHQTRIDGQDGVLHLHITESPV